MHLAFYGAEGRFLLLHGKRRCKVDIAAFDISRCRRPEKKECEGLCLSYDMLRGLCMETAGPCEALADEDDREDS